MKELSIQPIVQNGDLVSTHFTIIDTETLQDLPDFRLILSKDVVLSLYKVLDQLHKYYNRLKELDGDESIPSEQYTKEYLHLTSGVADGNVSGRLWSDCDFEVQLRLADLPFGELLLPLDQAFNDLKECLASHVLPHIKGLSL